MTPKFHLQPDLPSTPDLQPTTCLTFHFNIWPHGAETEALILLSQSPPIIFLISVFDNYILPYCSGQKRRSPPWPSFSYPKDMRKEPTKRTKESTFKSLAEHACLFPTSTPVRDGWGHLPTPCLHSFTLPRLQTLLTRAATVVLFKNKSDLITSLLKTLPCQKKAPLPYQHHLLKSPSLPQWFGFEFSYCFHSRSNLFLILSKNFT